MNFLFLTCFAYSGGSEQRALQLFLDDFYVIESQFRDECP